MMVGSLALLGCTSASSPVNGPQGPPNRGALRLAKVLPPRWTATPTDAHEIPSEPQVEPTTITGEQFQQPQVIGYSVEHRPLQVFRFGAGSKNLMIVAGIHGGYEWNTIALADELITFLNQNPAFVPEQASLHILRSMNPDGEQYLGSVLGRGNANDVDLNRNWNTGWQEALPQGGCWDLVPLTGGPTPASEPETQALMGFILENEIRALISYHSAGLGIFAGGHPSREGSLRLAEAISAVSDYPFPAIDIGCKYTGTLADWTSRRGIPSVDIELSTHWRTDFEQNLEILKVFLEWEP